MVIFIVGQRAYTRECVSGNVSHQLRWALVALILVDWVHMHRMLKELACSINIFSQHEVTKITKQVAKVAWNFQKLLGPVQEGPNPSEPGLGIPFVQEHQPGTSDSSTHLAAAQPAPHTIRASRTPSKKSKKRKPTITNRPRKKISQLNLVNTSYLEHWSISNIYMLLFQLFKTHTFLFYLLHFQYNLNR